MEKSLSKVTWQYQNKLLLLQYFTLEKFSLVTTKTANQLKPSETTGFQLETIQNHPKLSKTTQNYLKTSMQTFKKLFKSADMWVTDTKTTTFFTEKLILKYFGF